MAVVSKIVETGIALVALKFLFSVVEDIQSCPRFMSLEKLMKKKVDLIDSIAKEDESFETEVEDLLTSGPIPSEAFLQSQNIRLNMNADPEARMRNFVEAMTPKIVSATKNDSGLPDLVKLYKLNQYQNNPLDRVYSAAIMSWSAREFLLLEELRQLENYQIDKGFRENSLIIFKYLFYKGTIFNLMKLLAVFICGVLSSLYGA